MIFQLSMAIGALAAGVRNVIRAQPERRRPVAGAVVINFRHEIGLVLRRDRQQQLYWSLPKVRLVEGEEPEAGALRSVRESIGLGARIYRPLLVHTALCLDTHYYELIVERDDASLDPEAPLHCFVTLPEALMRIRSARDRAVLGRLLALRSEHYVDMGGR